MSGTVKYIIYAAMLNDFSGIHHRDLICHPGYHTEVMGNQNDRHAGLFLEVIQQIENLRLDGYVQRRGRLVGNQNRGFTGDGHGDHGPLQHAPGKFEGVLSGPLRRFRNLAQFEQLDGFGESLPVAVAPMHLQGFGDLIADGHGGIQGGHGVLKDHADLGATDFPAVDGIATQYFDSSQLRRARSDAPRWHRDQSHHRLHHHRLAAAGFAHDGQGLALLDRKIDTADSLHRAAVGIEFHGEVFHRKQRG